MVYDVHFRFYLIWQLFFLFFPSTHCLYSILSFQKYELPKRLTVCTRRHGTEGIRGFKSMPPDLLGLIEVLQPHILKTRTTTETTPKKTQSSNNTDAKPTKLHFLWDYLHVLHKYMLGFSNYLNLMKNSKPWETFWNHLKKPIFWNVLSVISNRKEVLPVVEFS